MWAERTLTHTHPSPSLLKPSKIRMSLSLLYYNLLLSLPRGYIQIAQDMQQCFFNIKQLIQSLPLVTTEQPKQTREA